ncbi:LysR family transcriptional regulator ArgP [Subtercola endophyticus]|uniref:LysR family transcriptional regulator ArgP n=1 Tax=Subtercola endophyticus TaxID=2895559 RepID=UPI001E29A9D9|nr:LysR family transcriptional regulator ArgP [Subtercola endophyticus]UFS60683.1 LysR family transcriptional regulator ArgP [Subtercola endophyticus]
MTSFHTDQLTTLLALVDEGTFERAAARLHITASAVSQRIKAMEQAAAQILVQRTNPVLPTAAGDIVLRHARQVALLEFDTALALGAAFGGVGGLDGDASRPGSDASGAAHVRPVSIAIAVNADSLGTWFLESLASLASTLNAVFDLHRDDQEHTTALLRSGTVLAAVTSTPEPVQGCTSEPLGTMRYRAVCSPAFAARWRPEVAQKHLPHHAEVHLRNADADAGTRVHAAEALPDADERFAWLATAPMLNFDRKDELQSGFLRARTHTSGHPPTAGSDQVAKSTSARTVGDLIGAPPTHYIPTTADFARATLLGLGWSLLPEQQCLGPIADGALIELDPEHPVDVPLYWQRWNLGSPTLTALTAAVRATAARTLHPPTAHFAQKHPKRDE